MMNPKFEKYFFGKIFSLPKSIADIQSINMEIKVDAVLKVLDFVMIKRGMSKNVTIVENVEISLIWTIHRLNKEVEKWRKSLKNVNKFDCSRREEAGCLVINTSGEWEFAKTVEKRWKKQIIISELGHTCQSTCNKAFEIVQKGKCI